MKIEDFKVGQRVRGVLRCSDMGCGTVAKVNIDYWGDIQALIILDKRNEPLIVKYDPENWELVQPEPAQQNDWSYAKADALLAAATKAIAEYNEYIQRKPSTYYGSISTAGTRIEPRVEAHDGDE